MALIKPKPVKESKGLTELHNHIAAILTRYVNQGLKVADIVLVLEMIKNDLVAQVYKGGTNGRIQKGSPKR